MRTAARSSLLVSLALATTLVACKGESKPKPDPVVDEPKVVALDAGAAIAVATIDAAPAPVDPNAPLTKPFFYTATKDGKTIHLLGSIHMGVDPKRLPPVVWDAASAAKAFAMEADISNPFALAKKLVRTDGKTLEEDLGPEYWKKLDDAIGKSLPPGTLEMLKGMKALVPMGQLEALGLPQTQPFEMAFLDNAKAKGQEIVYLEEATLQIDILDRWMDTEALKYQLDHLDEMKQAHEELFAGYIAGDESAMNQVTQASKDEWLAMGRKAEDYDKMTAELLHDRNAAWIPKIQELAAKNAFVVVGAAHLVGDGSVLDLLRKDGYTVERVTP